MCLFPHSNCSSVRRSSLRSERRACAADDVAGSPAELDVDDAVQDEIDGEVDEEQTVDDDRRRLKRTGPKLRPQR